MAKRKLSFLEQKELERLEDQKNMIIGEMMGKCDYINDQIKEVKSGSWLYRMKQYRNAIDIAEDPADAEKDLL